MAILDRVRDELYGSDEDQLKSEMAEAAVMEFGDSMSDPFNAWRNMILALTAEAGVIAALWFASAQVADFIFSDEYFIFLLAAPFLIGFVASFAGYRLFQIRFWPERRGTRQDPSPGFLENYDGAGWSVGQADVWVAGVLGGIANSVALFLLYMARA